ncbi:MAG TPA: phage holin family protein [Stellaceae bacterium]|nr:phage holin family protein [Stellaceae bacterium]
MGGIVNLALAILAEITTFERIRKRAPRIATAVLLVVLAFAVVAGGFGCAVAALWIWLLPVVGPWGAPLICAGVLILMAGGLIGGGYCLARSRPKTVNSTLATAIESGDFAPLIHEHRWLLLTLAALSGAAAAERVGKTARRKR